MPNAIYVGQEEMEALRLQEYIQNEMAQHWRPPSGMAKNLQCLVKIVIDRDGMLDAVIIEQSSGSGLFDSAARAAASQLEPSVLMHGKELLVTFKP